MTKVTNIVFLEFDAETSFLFPQFSSRVINSLLDRSSCIVFQFPLNNATPRAFSKVMAYRSALHGQQYFVIFPQCERHRFKLAVLYIYNSCLIVHKRYKRKVIYFIATQIFK